MHNFRTHSGVPRLQSNLPANLMSGKDPVILGVKSEVATAWFARAAQTRLKSGQRMEFNAVIRSGLTTQIC
jgi:hypothetical protein